MDKLAGRVNTQRLTLWKTLRNSVALPGFDYYEKTEMPKEIKFRFPAPGSCPQDKANHPHLFKNHWKTPWRNSRLNIRPIE
jgi:hypothetical protein